MVKRFWCFTRYTMLQNSIDDTKYVLENGVDFIKKRKHSEAIVNGFGNFIESSPTWTSTNIKLVFTEEKIDHRQTELGYTEFDGKTIIKCITLPQYDPKVNDIILIPIQYDPNSNIDQESDSVYKIRRIQTKDFDKCMGTNYLLIMEKRFNADKYFLE